MNRQKLIDTARMLVAGDKGLLAMDERNPTRNKRFARLGIPQTEEARRAWLELIVSTPGIPWGSASRPRRKTCEWFSTIFTRNG